MGETWAACLKSMLDHLQSGKQSSTSIKTSRPTHAHRLHPVWPENKKEFCLNFAKKWPKIPTHQHQSLIWKPKTSTLNYFWKLWTSHGLKLLAWVKIGWAKSSLNGKISPNLVTLTSSKVRQSRAYSIGLIILGKLDFTNKEKEKITTVNCL